MKILALLQPKYRSSILILIPFFILLFACIACSSSEENNSSATEYTEGQTNNSGETYMRLTTQNAQQTGQDMSQNQQNSIAPSSAWQNQQLNGNSVVITDRGLQIPMGTYHLPEGWQVFQSIAFDPNTGKQMEYKLDMLGPKNELIRGFPITEYGPFHGRNFEDSWKNPVVQSLNHQMSSLSIGQIRPSQRMQNSRIFRETSAEFSSQGMRLQALEVPFSGIFQGMDYKGMAFLTTTEIPMMHGTGMLSYSLITAPAEIFETALITKFQIDDSYQPNPQHRQRIRQLLQQSTQQAMASNQASFEAHQQRMATMRQGYDAHNKQWSDIFFGSGWETSTGSGYSSHDSFIDAITGHTTFDDPHSGFQIKTEGHYQYNYTDGMGNFYGTDDPNFNPNTLQGNWQYIEPVRPGN